jgi:predicted Zn-ribbon and HTH transcriptional regulator
MTTIPQYHCKQCDYKWLPRTVKPVKCPNCQSIHWDKKK